MDKKRLNLRNVRANTKRQFQATNNSETLTSRKKS